MIPRLRAVSIQHSKIFSKVLLVEMELKTRLKVALLGTGRFRSKPQIYLNFKSNNNRFLSSTTVGIEQSFIAKKAL